MRNLVVWLILLVVGLLVGFVPQYWKARDLRQKLSSCNAKEELAGAQQNAALTYVSATQLNYGVASGYAQQLFAQVQNLQNSTSDAGLRGTLTEVLASRDKITADLAKGNAEVVGELQPVVIKIEQAR